MNDDAKLKIVVKARQTGYSFAAALRAVRKCLERKTTWIFLSKGERQSRLLMEKVQEHVRAFGVVGQWVETDFMESVTVKQLEVRFPNGSVIYGLPANPETARGFTGNVTLDEFAFHADAEKIYTALFPSITRGFKLEVISTPNGQQGKFFELAKMAGLTENVKSENGKAKSGPSFDFRFSNFASAWSGHRVTIYEAVQQGLARQLQIPDSEFLSVLRAGLADDAWRQEYCCEFISTASQWIPPELWQSCVSSEASLVPGPLSSATDKGLMTSDKGQFFAGWDIARKRDFSVIWICELVGDVTWTRGVITLRNTPTPDQIREARMLLRGDWAAAASPHSIRASDSRDWARRGGGVGGSGETWNPSRQAPGSERSQGANLPAAAGRGPNPEIRRMGIDMSGMGLAIFEQLAREFPGRVEGVQFTQAKKEAMAVRVKERMEKRLLRLPDDDEIRQSFMALKRQVTATGLVRFDSEHDTHYGHSDHFWACALAEAAAEQPTANWQECALLAGEPVSAGLRDRVL